MIKKHSRLYIVGMKNENRLTGTGFENTSQFQQHFRSFHRGVGGSSDCQGMWPLIRHFSHLLKGNKTF